MRKMKQFQTVKANAGIYCAACKLKVSKELSLFRRVTYGVVSGLMGGGQSRYKKRVKQLQTVTAKVRIYCDRCELKVNKGLTSVRRVRHDIGNRCNKKKKQFQTTVLKFKKASSSIFSLGYSCSVRRVRYGCVPKAESVSTRSNLIVTGYVDGKEVLKKAQSSGKKAELSSYTAHNLVSQPYASVSYDKNAQLGYVNASQPSPQTGTVSQSEFDQDSFFDMFSDENPNACSIM